MDSLKASINSLAGHCSRPKDHVSSSQSTDDLFHCREIPIIFLINIPITFDTTLSIQAFPFWRLFSKHLIASGMESIDSTTKTRQTTDSGRSKTVTTMTTTMQRANQNEDKQNQRGKYLHFFSSFLSSPSTLLLLFIEIHSLGSNTKYTTPTEWQESTTVLIEMLAVIRNRRRRMVRSPKVKWKLTRGKNRMGTKRRQMEKQMLTTTTTSMMVSARWWSIESWERERSNERVRRRERDRVDSSECVCVSSWPSLPSSSSSSSSTPSRTMSTAIVDMLDERYVRDRVQQCVSRYLSRKPWMRGTLRTINGNMHIRPCHRCGSAVLPMEFQQLRLELKWSRWTIERSLDASWWCQTYGHTCAVRVCLCYRLRLYAFAYSMHAIAV